MTDNTLLYKIAKAYYEDGFTQDQIGKRFGVSRIKVSRLLQQARQSRVVQITITPPADSFGDLERDLETAYPLDEVVVVSTSPIGVADLDCDQVIIPSATEKQSKEFLPDFQVCLTL